MRGQFGKVLVDETVTKEVIGVDFDIENGKIHKDKHTPIYFHKRFKHNGEFVDESLVKFGSGDREFHGMTMNETFKAIFEDKAVRGDHVKATHLLIIPKRFKHLEWDDTLVGNKILRHIEGAKKLSRDDGFGDEVIEGSNPEEMARAIRKYFVGSKRPSIWNSGGGLHTFQKEAYNRIYENVKRQIQNGNTDVLKVLAYLCPRYGKTRLFLVLMKDLYEDFGYEVMVIPAFWLSSHSSFQKTLTKWREFSNMAHIDPNQNGWKKRLKSTYFDDDLIPVVTPSLCIEDTSKRKLVPITKIPRGERFIPVDEFDFGAWKNTELIKYIVERENKVWGNSSTKDGLLVHVNTTGSGIQECVADGQNYDEVMATSYGAMEQAKRNGDPSMQHVVLRNYGRWKIGSMMKQNFKSVFGEETSPGWTQLGKDVDQAERIWTNVAQVMFNGQIPTINDRGQRIIKSVGAASIPGAAKKAGIPSDTIGTFLILPDMENEEIVKLRKIFQKTVGHNWPVLALHGGIEGAKTRREKGTSNSEAESYTNQFIDEEVNPNVHDGFIVMSSRMAFRSFSVPELYVGCFLRDGGSADVADQAGSRPNTPGNLLGGQKKEESLIIEYGLDQRRDLTPIEKIWAHETVQELQDPSNDNDTIEETFEMVTPPQGDFLEYSARNECIGEVDLESDSWDRVARSNHIARLIRTNADRQLIENDERVKELVTKAGASSGRSKTDGEKNADVENDNNGGKGGASNTEELDEDQIEQCVNTIKHMCFLIRDFAPDQKDVIKALRKISKTDHLKEEWIYLSKAGNPEAEGLAPEGFIELLTDKEFIDVSYLNTVYTARDEVYEEAFDFIMATNKLYEIPRNVAESMADSLREQISNSPRSSHRTSDKNGLKACVIDAAGPNLIRALKNVGAVKSVTVLTRLHLVKRYIEENIDGVEVEVVRGEDELEAYEQALQSDYSDMEFDIVAGNPPYHESTDGHGAQARPIYDDFVDMGYDVSNRYLLMVTKSRWFEKNRFELKSFRDRQTNRNIVKLRHWTSEKQPFKEQIKGGVSYFLIDEEANDTDKTNYNGYKVDLSNLDFIPEFPEYAYIVSKIFENHNGDYLDEIYNPRSRSGIRTNDPGFRDQDGDNLVTCYVSQDKGFKKYIDPKKDDRGLGYHKVLTQADPSDLRGWGDMIISEPNETFSFTYHAFETESKEQSENLAKYLQLDIPKFMLMMRKNSHHINGNTVEAIPLLDLDKRWSNEEVYKEMGVEDDKELVQKALNEIT